MYQFSIVFVLGLASIRADDRIVKTEYGLVRGTVEKSLNGNEILAFYGIPFAAPPVGHLRLKPPQAPTPWSDTRNATQWPPMCLQRGKSGVIGDEDCLYLNVFVPRSKTATKNHTNELLPVMVYIYGGGFCSGASSKYPPNYLLDKSIVLVSMNYRLGALGFLGHGTNVISGNFGLKDQSFALRWVNRNIELFGGNPNEVTIFGQSAGSISIHLHAFNPLSTGLYHRAIMQSGTAFSGFSFHNTDDGRALATAFAVIAGCHRKTSEATLVCLQKLNAKAFVTIEKKLFIWFSEPLVLFGPIVEGENVKDAALPRLPRPENYISTKIPWIMGITTGEGIFHILEFLKENAKLAVELNKDYRRLLPIVLSYQHTQEPHKLDSISDKLKEHYFQNRSIGAHTDLALIKLYTDTLFTYPAEKTVKEYTGKVYFYVYSYRMKKCYPLDTPACLPEEYGVNHSDELPLLFPKPGVPAENMTASDKFVSQKLIEFWTNFATYGDPNGQNTNKTWIPTGAEELRYLNITSTEIQMKENHDTQQREFFEDLFGK